MDKIRHRAVIEFFVKKCLGPTNIHKETVDLLRDGVPLKTLVSKRALEFKRGLLPLKMIPAVDVQNAAPTLHKI